MQRTFSNKDATISYKVLGKGVTVLLLHGFGEDGSVWYEQSDFLKEYCKLIIPDLPGSGASFFANENDGDAIEQYVEIINSLLEHEKTDSCIILGHSMGGYITLAFAEKYASLLKGFGFIHSTAFADSDEKKQNRLKGIGMMEEYGGYAFLKTTTPNLFATKFKKEQPERIEALIERGKIFSTKALQQYYKAMMNRPDRTTVLANSSVPVLFVLGTEDVAAPLNDVLKQTHLPDISFLHVLEDTGHMGMWENADKVNNAMFEFISSIIAQDE